MKRRLFIAAPLILATLLVILALIHQAPGPAPIPTDVQELLSSHASAAAGRTVSVIGTVQPSSRHTEGHTEWAFTLERDGLLVPVRYAGPVPSTFRDGAVVMVIGTMRDGTFSATNLLVRM